MRFRVLARKGVPRARGVDVASMSSVAASFPRTGRFAGHGEGDRPTRPSRSRRGGRASRRNAWSGEIPPWESRQCCEVGVSCWSPPGCWWPRWWAAPDAAGVTWRRSPRSSPARLRSGFSFSCERSSNSVSPNPQAGRLRIQLSYTDHGANPLGSSFSIHGDADRIDPVLESTICIGQNPPPTPNELIFLGTLPGVHIGSSRVPDIVPRHRDRGHTIVSLRGHRP